MSHHREWIVVFEGGPPSGEVIMSQQKRPVHKSSQLGCVIFHRFTQYTGEYLGRSGETLSTRHYIC